MENQVTSVEQSKRLLELGVPAERASMRWTTIRIDDDDYKAVIPRSIVPDDCIETPAFTVVDLMELLPFEINVDCGLCYLQIKKLYAGRDYTEWGVYYKNAKGDTPLESTTSYGIVDALFDMMEKITYSGGYYELNL